MARERGVPNKSHDESATYPWGAVPHEQFPQERMREQRILEGKPYLSHEVADVDMEFVKHENILGTNIAVARERAGYTQEEIANALGVSVRTVRMYESGSVVPNALQVRFFSIVYGVSTDWLLGLIGDDEAEILDYYSFSTPSIRKAILVTAKRFQAGSDDNTKRAVSNDRESWIAGAEERMERLRRRNENR